MEERRESLRPGWLARSAAIAVSAFAAIVAVQALTYTPLLSWRLFWATRAPSEWAVGLTVFAVLIVLVALTWRRLQPLLEQIGASVARVSTVHWLLITVATGLIFRLAWAEVFPVKALSDGATYFLLARRLAAGDTYEVAGSLAYWPPGFPLLLSVPLRLIDAERATTLWLNLVMYLLASMATYALARRAGSDASAKLATLILAVWPGYATAAGVVAKEHILIAALPAVVLLHDHAASMRRPAVGLVGAGALLGLCTLIQPSLLLFPAVLVVMDLIASRRFGQCAMRIALVALSMALVIAPWTVRNYRVFDEFILISTNGGSNFYRANNPHATGGYTQRGEVEFSGLSEAEESRRAFALGRAWVAENPLGFLRLAVEKQVLFLGGSAYGIYATLRAGSPAVPSTVYAAAKAAANAYWMALWMLAGIAILQRLKRRSLSTAQTNLYLPILFFWALHSIFESDEKYHLPAIGFIAIAASLAFLRPPKP